MTITTRAVKGTALSHAEMDANFNLLKGLDMQILLANAPYSLKTDMAPAQVAEVINKAIQDAIPGRKTVVFPSGVFLTDPIAYDPRVSLLGQGQVATELVANQAGAPLIGYTDNKLYNQCGTIEGFTLSSANKATACLRINLGCFARYRNLTLGASETGWAMDMSGTLLSEFTNILLGGGNGIRNTEFNGAQNATPSGGVNQNLKTIQPNMCTLTGCGFYSVPGDSLYWDRGVQTVLQSCVWEGNSSTGPGSVRYLNSCPNGENIGLVMKDCWWEVNTGTQVYIGPALGHAKHSLQGCMMQQFHTVADAGVYLDARDGFRQELSIRDSSILGHTLDVKGNGTSARILEDFSQIGTHNEDNGSQFGKVYNTFNFEPGTRSNDARYIQAVKESRPYYFSTMTSPTALANPINGDGPLTIGGTGVTSGVSSGLFAGVTTTEFSGTDSYLSHALDLSRYSEFGIEFIIDATAGAQKTWFAFGDYGASGAMAMSYSVSYAGSPDLLYLGVSGIGGYDEKYYHLPALTGVHHVFVKLSTEGAVLFMLDGVALTPSFDDHGFSTTTGAFQNSALFIMGNANSPNDQAGKLGYLAFYVGSNIPTFAEVQAHNAARA